MKVFGDVAANERNAQFPMRWATFSGRPVAAIVSQLSSADVIIEHVLLPVKPGQEADFEAAFTQAKVLIRRAVGCEGVTLSRCVERPSTYLLLVEWARIEDHMQGFRESDDYQEWRRVLHHFYDPAPVVEHFVPTLEA